MPDRFDDLMREKLGGFNAAPQPSNAGSHADVEADWSAMASRLDAVEAARNRKSDKRIGLWLFAFIALGSVALGTWYQLDGPDRSMDTPLAESRSPAGEQALGAFSEQTEQTTVPAPAQTQAQTAVQAPAQLPGQALALPADPQQRTSENTDADKGLDPANRSDAERTAAASAPQNARASFEAPTASLGAAASRPEKAPLKPEANPSLADLSSSVQTSIASDPVLHSADRSLHTAAVVSESTLDAEAHPALQEATRSKQDLDMAQRVDALMDEVLGSQNARASSGGTVQNKLPPSLRVQYLALPVQTILAQAGPYRQPEERLELLSDAPSDKKDFSLRKLPLRYAITVGPDLNAAFTGVGDAIRPSWDLNLSGEVWFPKQVFVSAGLRYGLYRFHKVDVHCGDHHAHGLSENVHCPDAMTGDQSLWEIPIRVGYGVDVAKGKGRIRGFAGLTTRIQRAADYAVEFHGVGAGDTLFFDPVVITVAEGGSIPESGNYSYDTETLENMATSTNTFVGTSSADPENDAIASTTKRTSLAIEFGMGYEQFLAPSISLGIEPRLSLPLQSLPLNNGRAYHLAAGAKLRWYPGRR